MSSRSRLSTAALVAAFCFCSQTASALDSFEVQVYGPDINDPGQFALEVHTNYTILGRKSSDYPGELAPNHVGRLTLEPAIGVFSWLELGAYLQAMVTPSGEFGFGGAKFRTKIVPTYKSGDKCFWGVNVEVGRVPRRISDEGWANEFRPFIGWDNGYWLFDINPIMGYALSGKDAFKPDFEPAAKIGWNTQHWFMVGAEYFASLGRIDQGFDALKAQEHMLYGVVDLATPVNSKSPNSWELNVGLGHSLTPGTNNIWSLKTIVGKSF